MSFYSRWQPLVDEDRHTALVFGFLRHAPVELALYPLAGARFWPAGVGHTAGAVGVLAYLALNRLWLAARTRL